VKLDVFTGGEFIPIMLGSLVGHVRVYI